MKSFLVFSFLVCATSLLAQSLPARADSIDLPPVERHFESPSRTYSLVVNTADDWRTAHAGATLTDKRGSIVWKKELRQYHGPRYALVGDRGSVLFIDEWINVLSPYAVQLYSRSGDLIAQYSAQQIIAFLAVAPDLVGEAAKVGPWLSALPMLTPDSMSAIFNAAGKRLRVSLETGKLSLSN